MNFSELMELAGKTKKDVLKSLVNVPNIRTEKRELFFFASPSQVFRIAKRGWHFWDRNRSAWTSISNMKIRKKGTVCLLSWEKTWFRFLEFRKTITPTIRRAMSWCIGQGISQEDNDLNPNIDWATDEQSQNVHDYHAWRHHLGAAFLCHHGHKCRIRLFYFSDLDGGRVSLGTPFWNHSDFYRRKINQTRKIGIRKTGSSKVP